MQNKIVFAFRAVAAALCFLTAFFGCAEKAYAESGQLTHRHTGSSQNGGGCYGTERKRTYTCGSYNLNIGFNGTTYTYVCRQCGNRWDYPNELSGARCDAKLTSTYYEPNCGKDGAAAVSFSCEPSTCGWAKEIDLTASYSVHEDGISVSGFLWNGTPGGAGFHVTENGTYTLGLTGSGNVDFSPTVSVIVDHIDHTPPEIASFQASSDAWQSSVELLVNASDAESGLAAEAYSFDGGVSWGTSPVYTVTKNGTYCVSVRDVVGNVKTAETTVSCLDNTPPVVSVATSPSAGDWYEGGLTVNVQAQDTESGLADAPYSFDGGASYLVGNSATLSESGVLEIAVKDRAGNVTRLSFHAEKKQRPQPTASPGSGNESSTGGSGNAGAGGSGSVSGTGSSNGEAGLSGGAGTQTAGTGKNDSDAGGITGEGLAAGTGSTAAGMSGDGFGTDAVGNSGVEGGTGASGSTGGNKNSGKGAGVAGISGGSGSPGRGNSGGQGNPNIAGNHKGGNGTSENKDSYENGKRSGLGGMLSGKNAENRYSGPEGNEADALQTPESGMRQHYPDSLPRIESVTGSGTEEYEEGRDGTEADSLGTEADSPGAEADGGAVGNEGDGFDEEAVIQNELLASADGQEAAMLQNTGSVLNAVYDPGNIVLLSICAVVLAAAAFGGWVLLFGIRVDTRDERGHYRFAGITRVTADKQERLRVVPLTKQIIRNSRTNALRIRFGLLCHKRCEGETLLLRYRSMKREFEAKRTVELHIRA